MTFGTSTLLSIRALITLFYFAAVFKGHAQLRVADTTIHVNRLLGVIPYLSGGGTVGYCQEWYRIDSHRSVAVSFDYLTRTNMVNTTPQKYYSINFRPGIRYYYSQRNKWFYHTISMLASYENNPMPWRSALSFGVGISVIGFRILVRTNIILELEGFLGFGVAHITPYHDESFYQGRLFSLNNFRIGYRFNRVH